MYEVVFYEDKNGNSEIGDYFEKISQSKQKVDYRMKLATQLVVNKKRHSA